MQGRSIAAPLLFALAWLAIAGISPASGGSSPRLPEGSILTKRAKVERGHTVRLRVRCEAPPGARCTGELVLTSMRTTRFFDDHIPLTDPHPVRMGAGEQRVVRLKGFDYARPKRGQRRRGFAYVRAVVRLIVGADTVKPVKVVFKRRG